MAFLEMEKEKKILVINGVSLLDFKFELMTCIYHLKNIMFWDLFGCLFSPAQTGAIEDHSGVGKYQGNTLTCRRFIALAMVRAHWKSYPPPKKRKKTEGGQRIYYIIYRGGIMYSSVFQQAL